MVSLQVKLIGGQSCQVDTDGLKTYLDLKKEVAQRFEIDVSELRMVAGGKLLKDEDAICETIHGDIRVARVTKYKEPKAEPKAVSKAKPKGIPNFGNLDPSVFESFSGIFDNTNGKLDFGEALKQMTTQMLQNPEAMTKAMEAVSDVFGIDKSPYAETFKNPANMQSAMKSMSEMLDKGDNRLLDELKNIDIDSLMKNANLEELMNVPGTADIIKSMTQSVQNPTASTDYQFNDDTKLKALNDMGFNDDAANLKALNDCKGDLDECVKRLLSEL